MKKEKTNKRFGLNTQQYFELLGLMTLAKSQNRELDTTAKCLEKRIKANDPELDQSEVESRVCDEIYGNENNAVESLNELLRLCKYDKEQNGN